MLVDTILDLVGLLKHKKFSKFKGNCHARFGNFLKKLSAQSMEERNLQVLNQWWTKISHFLEITISWEKIMVCP